MIKNHSAKHKNIRLLFVSLFFVWSIGEIVFSFIPQSQGNTPNGLARNLWYFYYSNPTNSLYYRDKAVEESIVKSRKNVFFVGDSYTYGQGIKNERNRFTNIISDRIKNKYNAFNLGRVRSDTKDEYDRLIDYPVKPDVIIWQYYYNDIEGVARENGYLQEKKYGFTFKVVYTLALIPARCSFFLNYILVNASKYAPLITGNKNNYHEELMAVFNDSSCVNTHLNEIKTVVDYCRVNNVKICFLLIPDVVDPMFSKNELYDKYIIPYLNKQECDYITFDEELMKHDYEKLIVNDIDYHLNEFGHRIIANKLINTIPEFK